MELWIRSQDKEELRPQPKLGIDKVENLFYIVDRYNFRQASILGTYETKERALEVLDEIQKLLQPQILCKKGKIAGSFDNTIIREADGFEIKELSTYVYEMPKE